MSHNTQASVEDDRTQWLDETRVWLANALGMSADVAETPGVEAALGRASQSILEARLLTDGHLKPQEINS